jgi:hypothetical protein
MIGRGDGDGVDIFVLKQLANIDVGFWLWQTQFLDVPEALVQNVFIHIAQGGNLCSWDARKTVKMIIAAASHSANCHPDTIVRAEDLAAQRKRSCAHSDCFSRRLKKFTPLDCHSCLLVLEARLQAA